MTLFKRENGWSLDFEGKHYQQFHLVTFYILPLLLKYPCTVGISVYSSVISYKYYIQKQSHVKPSKLHKKLPVSFRDSKTWYTSFWSKPFFSFHVEIRNNCDGCPTPYQISNCSRRLLLKSAKRTGEFYRSSIVKWFSSMPRNSSIIVNLNSLLVLRNHCLYNPIFGAVFKKHIFPIFRSLKY